VAVGEEAVVADRRLGALRPVWFVHAGTVGGVRAAGRDRCRPSADRKTSRRRHRAAGSCPRPGVRAVLWRPLQRRRSEPPGSAWTRVNAVGADGDSAGHRPARAHVRNRRAAAQGQIAGDDERRRQSQGAVRPPCSSNVVRHGGRRAAYRWSCVRLSTRGRTGPLASRTAAGPTPQAQAAAGPRRSDGPDVPCPVPARRGQSSNQSATTAAARGQAPPPTGLHSVLLLGKQRRPLRAARPASASWPGCGAMRASDSLVLARPGGRTMLSASKRPAASPRRAGRLLASACP
jgi:hypothetical protein